MYIINRNDETDKLEKKFKPALMYACIYTHAHKTIIDIIMLVGFMAKVRYCLFWVYIRALSYIKQL